MKTTRPAPAASVRYSIIRDRRYGGDLRGGLVSPSPLTALAEALLIVARIQARAANGRDRSQRPASRRPLAPFRYDSHDLAKVLATSGAL